MSREVALVVLDVLIRGGFAVWAFFCIRYVWNSFRRGHVFINGQPATRQAEPLGFWLAVLSLLAVVYLSGYVVLNGL